MKLLAYKEGCMERKLMDKSLRPLPAKIASAS